MTKAQFQSGALTTANRKSLLRHEQFLSGVEDDSFKKHTLLQGEIHTGTGLILEKDAMVNGEVWGDKHDKQDKFNEQVKYSNVSKTLFSKCLKRTNFVLHSYHYVAYFCTYRYSVVAKCFAGKLKWKASLQFQNHEGNWARNKTTKYSN